MKKIKILSLIILLLLSQRAYSRELTQEERILKQEILYEAGSNYLENAYSGGSQIVRWNKSEFPIKVYIKPSSIVPSYYATTFRQAVSIWQKELPDVLKFRMVGNKSGANICFEIIEQKKLIREIKKTDTRTLAYTKTYTSGKVLKNATIYVYSRRPDGKYYDQTELLNLAVHELGHALGISGHSEDSTSVMYALYQPQHKKTSGFLNKEDKSTVKLLYRITPDVTNGDPKKETGTIRADIIAGSQEERRNASIQNAHEEISVKPGDCASRLNMAALYEEKKDYNNMLLYIQKAEPLAKTNEELYSVHFAYGIYYYRVKDKKNALYHTNKAYRIKGTKEVAEFKQYVERLK